MSSPKTSTQEHIPFSAIYDDVLVTKKGQFCQVLMVHSVNFGLKSEEEQNAIIYQYQAFLNSLSFPIQIVMHSKRLDLTSYIKDLEGRITQEANELIRYQIQEYVDFISKLISIANIMDKKFFIIIPHQMPPGELSGSGFFASIFGNPAPHLQVSLKKFDLIKEELDQRTSVVINGLTSIGISSQVLSTKQIIELFYRVYNPDEAMQEKLRDDIESFGVKTEQVKEAIKGQAVSKTSEAVGAKATEQAMPKIVPAQAAAAEQSVLGGIPIAQTQTVPEAAPQAKTVPINPTAPNVAQSNQTNQVPINASDPAQPLPPARKSNAKMDGIG